VLKIKVPREMLGIKRRRRNEISDKITS